MHKYAIKGKSRNKRKSSGDGGGLKQREWKGKTKFTYSEILTNCNFIYTFTTSKYDFIVSF